MCLCPPAVCQEAPKADVPCFWERVCSLLWDTASAGCHSGLKEFQRGGSSGLENGLRSTLCLWLSCSGLSAQNRHDIILRARAFQPVVRGAVKFPYLRTVECCGVLGRETFSEVSPTPQCFSQMLFASKLPGFEIQVRCWMKKTILPHIALTAEVADLFFKGITAPLGNGVLLCFLL